MEIIMNIKNKVMVIVNSKVVGAQDDLYRAKRQFSGLDSEGLKTTYGQSGKACGDILQEYEDKVVELEKCLEWINSQGEK